MEAIDLFKPNKRKSAKKLYVVYSNVFLRVSKISIEQIPVLDFIQKKCKWIIGKINCFMTTNIC